jgi:hypothetical protein
MVAPGEEKKNGERSAVVALYFALRYEMEMDGWRPGGFIKWKREEERTKNNIAASQWIG